MSDRYFVDQPISLGRVVLAGSEAHHLIHVMRAKPGLRVVLFDGNGAEFAAVVEQVGRDEVELSALSRDPIDRELPLELTLGVALPKGDRQKWLVEKAVELGVTQIVPLRTQRGVTQPVERSLRRLRRTVVEASKQCGRNRLLQIEQSQSWPDFVEDATDVPCRLLAQPQGFHQGSHLPIPAPEEKGVRYILPERPDQPSVGAQCFAQNVPDPFFPRIRLAIGPEGGFTGEEVALAVAAGWHTVDLGPRILRVETAALLLATIVVERFSR